MNKKLDDNKAFILISLISIAISMIGLAANSICNRYGGYAIGIALAAILFAVICYIYAGVSESVKIRTRDYFFMSLFVLVLYAIMTLLVDISLLARATLGALTGMGITAQVFIGLFWAIGVWELTRLVLDMFGIRIKWYEELLEGKIPFVKKEKANEGGEEEVVIEKEPIINDEGK